MRNTTLLSLALLLAATLTGQILSNSTDLRSVVKAEAANIIGQGCFTYGTCPAGSSCYIYCDKTEWNTACTGSTITKPQLLQAAVGDKIGIIICGDSAICVYTGLLDESCNPAGRI